MISFVLERLEQSGGNTVALDRPRRWCAGAVSGSFGAQAGSGGSSSSGRVRTTSTLEAERTDDGVLVTAPAGLRGQRIVWIGDVELELADGTRLPGIPRFLVDAADSRVEVVWSLCAPEVRVRLTVPCRPVGALTFQNEDLDPTVEVEREAEGTYARLQPYSGLPALRIAFNGELSFEAEPCWRRGIGVLDERGGQHVEDRFSPGVFVVRRPGSARTLRLAASVDPAEVAAVPPSPDGAEEPRSALIDALAAPGLAIDAHWSSEDLAAWLTPRLARAASAPGTDDSRVFADDRQLWLARAAQLVLGRAGACDRDPRADELRRDVIGPGIGRIVDAVLEKSARHGGDPVAPFRGALRWYEVLAGQPSTGRSALGVETAALLHQLFVLDARLAEDARDARRASRARGLALGLHRWFQRSFWLPTPRRLADVEVDRILPGDGAALALRPHMLIAASLEGAPLDRAQRRAVVHAVDARLLSSLGVRSLDRADAQHDASSFSDGAVWPWLLGPYVEASLRALGRECARARAYGVFLDALDGAPEAWSERGDDAAPLGALCFPPATGEAARAHALLASAPEDPSPRPLETT